MKITMTKPCLQCPFRSDIFPYLTKDRVRELKKELLSGKSFHCHKTVDYEKDSRGVITNESQMCAGSMILLEKMDRPNQMMRIAERLGMYDRHKLDMDFPIYDSFEEMIDAQPF